MAHFAKIGINGKVLQVVTVDNNDLMDSNNVEDERVGQQYLQLHSNWPAELWIQTSYNTLNNQHSLGGTALRGNYAGIGYTWDEENNIFWSPKPYASWVKNTTTAAWESPIGDAPALTAEQLADESNVYHYSWNEENQTWDLETSAPRSEASSG
tara:strand:+ start:52 stop:513 length:462 start_codon:yes stop_codon:yes gene_type:complete